MLRRVWSIIRIIIESFPWFRPETKHLEVIFNPEMVDFKVIDCNRMAKIFRLVRQYFMIYLDLMSPPTL